MTDCTRQTRPAVRHTLPENHSGEHRQCLLCIRGDRKVIDQLRGLQNIGDRSLCMAEDQPTRFAMNPAMERDQLTQGSAGDVLHRFQIQHELSALVMVNQGLQVLSHLFEVVVLREARTGDACHQSRAARFQREKR